MIDGSVFDYRRLQYNQRSYYELLHVTVVKSPLEVRDYTMAETKDAKFLPFAFVGGVLKGSFYMVKKMAHGAWDIATFPIDR